MSGSQKSIFSADICRQLLKIRIENELNHIPSPKSLYSHKQILNIINFAFQFKFQSVGVSGQIYEFQDNPKAIDSDKSPNVIFFIYAKPSSMATISSIILHNEASYIKKQYFLFFVPEVDYMSEEELRRLNVLDKVKIKKFDFNFIPITERLLSLELPFHLTSVQEESCIVESLLKLQFMRGSFKNIVAKGRKSKEILSTLQERRKSIAEIVQEENDEDVLIMLDRSIDLITPNLTGLSYECLLDFFFGIDLNRINIPDDTFEDKEQKIGTFLLNNKKDPVYEDIAFMNIKDVPAYLNEYSKKLREKITAEKQQAKGYEALNKLNNTLMVEYVLVQNHQKLVLHILQKMKTIQFNNSLLLESSIIQGDDSEATSVDSIQYLSLFYPLQHLLRLMALKSQVSDRSKFYTKHQKQFVECLLNCQRIDALPYLYSLVNGEVIRQSKYKNPWKETSDKFNLFPQEPDSYTHVNIIYSSLIVRTVELILKNRLDPEKNSLLGKDSYYAGTIPKFKSNNRIFIFIQGGVSYNEISCFRALEKRYNKKLILLSTEILGKNQLVKKYLKNPMI